MAAGSGVWGIAFALASPLIQITAVDWPAVLQVTREMAAQFQLQDRLRCIEGDILEIGFGSDYTVATLGNILHSEGERRSRLLLKKTFDALTSQGTIVIGDWLVNAERTGPVDALISAVNMLVRVTLSHSKSSEHGLQTLVLRTHGLLMLRTPCHWLSQQNLKRAESGNGLQNALMHRISFSN